MSPSRGRISRIRIGIKAVTRGRAANSPSLNAFVDSRTIKRGRGYFLVGSCCSSTSFTLLI